MGSEVVDRLWIDRVLREYGLPRLAFAERWGADPTAAWFTLFALIGTMISWLASRMANRFAARALTADRPTRTMATLTALQLLAVAGFAVAPWLWLGLSLIWLREAATVVATPVRQAWLNRVIYSSARATTLSMMGQGDAVGQVAGGPLFGGIAQRAGISVALLCSALAQLPSVALLLRLRPDPEGRAGAEQGSPAAGSGAGIGRAPSAEG